MIMFGWRPSAEDGQHPNYSVVRRPGPHLTGIKKVSRDDQLGLADTGTSAILK
ncbi:MAG: hypothetical protein HDS98_06160 [Bacteroidales bacterium]|nr:hypothetical protein [Bacteroidales bacterium]